MEAPTQVRLHERVTAHVLGLILLAATVGCSATTTTDPRLDDASDIQFTRTSAELERRDQEVERDDLLILLRADELLADESLWNHQDDRVCTDDEHVGRRSLFCALHQASLDVAGEYQHRRVALQEVRFVVEDATDGRDFAHRLRDFNNLPEIGFEEIKEVLQVAVARVRTRIEGSAH